MSALWMDSRLTAGGSAIAHASRQRLERVLIPTLLDKTTVGLVQQYVQIIRLRIAR